MAMNVERFPFALNCRGGNVEYVYVNVFQSVVYNLAITRMTRARNSRTAVVGSLVVGYACIGSQ